MAKAIALARHAIPETALFEAVRCTIVCGCALALIAAGHNFPF
ncbi:MAG: hypothetical protein AB7G24_04550 [Novosphingobium sp.]|jgi:hypothetical protein